MEGKTFKDYKKHPAFKGCKEALKNNGFDFDNATEEEQFSKVVEWFNNNDKKFRNSKKKLAAANPTLNSDDIDNIMEQLLKNNDLTDEVFRTLTKKAYGLKTKLLEIAKKKEQLAELENDIKNLEAAYEADKKEILSYK